MLITAFAMLCGAGGAPRAAIAMGKGDKETAEKIVGNCFTVLMILAALLTAVFYFAAPTLLDWFGGSEATLPYGITYARIYVLGSIFVLTVMGMNPFITTQGFAKFSMLTTVIGAGINIVLDPLFIFVFDMGVAGAAIATVVAQGVSVVLCIFYILKYTRILVPEARHFSFDKELYSDVGGQGYAMALMGSIVSVGSIILQSGINSLGTEIIAGHVAARKIYMICNLPFISMSVAVSAFISQNKGANQGDRILRALKSPYLYDFVMAAIVSAILFLSAPKLVQMISGSTNPVIINNGSKMLYIVGPFYAVLGVLIQTRFALQGIGSKVIPMISSVIELVGKILFVYIFIPKFQYDAVVWCEPLIWVAMTAQLLYAFNTNSYVKEIRSSLKTA
jgi:putative MATE family efflux protein